MNLETRRVFSVPKTMSAVVYRGPNDLRVETLPVPRIGANELLVKVVACGVCPTDIKKIHYGTVPPPRVFGHETAGTIVKIGARVRGFRIGDRVALHHHVPCLDCHACRHRAFAQCPQYKRTGITAGFEPAGGGYAEYVRVMSFVLPGVVKIPARNTFIEGAMQEPVNTVLKAVKRLSILPGDTVLVAGQGPIGLMFTRLLALRGVRVVASDLMDTRLKLSRSWGAWKALKAVPPEVGPAVPGGPGQYEKNKVGPAVPSGQPTKQDKSFGAIGTSRPTTPLQSGAMGTAGSTAACAGQDVTTASDFADSIDRLTKERGLDAAIIAVPSDAAVLQAVKLVRGAGQVLLFAHTRRREKVGRDVPIAPDQNDKVGRDVPIAPDQNDKVAPAVPSGPKQPCLDLDLSAVCVDEKDLIGSYSSDFTLQKEVARLVFGRKLDVRRLVTHEFPLAKTSEAVDLTAHPHPSSLKIMVLP